MKNEKLYLYFYIAQIEEADKLYAQIQSYGLEAELINLETQNTDLELVNGLIEQSNNPFPILRIGELKIRAMFQNPNIELLEKLFSDKSENLELPQATIYSTAWCGDCRQLKMWMDSQKISYKENPYRKF